MTLSLYEDVAAPPGEARLKVYRIGPPLSLSEVLPILSTTGVEVVDERPYQLEGLERESYIYDFGLRYHARDARPTRASCSRTPSRRCGTATTRATASTRSSSRPGSPGARRRCCVPTRSTCARAAPRSRRTTSRTRCATTSRSPATSCSSSRRGSTPAAGRRNLAADGESRAGQVRRPRGAHHARARRRLQPRPRPDPALLPDQHPRHPAHQLLPDRRRRRTRCSGSR